jgi:DNA invertase Pin-like site-specific DNA recombinase
MADFVAYYRVSTQGQGNSGLGLDAQRAAVHAHVQQVGGGLIGEFTEIESGALDERTELNLALKQCRAQKALLVIAKLDRLARSVHFIAQLLNSGVEFVAADMPHANKLTIHIIAAVAEYEREVIAQRTKAALSAAKLRGVRLGNPRAAEAAHKGREIMRDEANDYARGLMPIFEGLRTKGVSSYSELARALAERGIPTRRGGQWTAAGVSNIVKRQTDLGFELQHRFQGGPIE